MAHVSNITFTVRTLVVGEKREKREREGGGGGGGETELSHISYLAQNKLVNQPLTQRRVAVVPQVFSARQPRPAIAIAVVALSQTGACTRWERCRVCRVCRFVT